MTETEPSPDENADAQPDEQEQPEPTLDEYEAAVENFHDTLDALKERAPKLAEEIAERADEIDDEAEAAEWARVAQASMMAGQRVARGDSALLRGK